MGVAAPDNRLAEAPREIVRQLIRPFENLAVECFNSVKIACKHGEVVFRPRSGQAGIEMIYGNEELIFDRIGKQALDVMATALQFDMVAFPDSINARVHFSTARHGAGDFFAQEEMGIARPSSPGANEFLFLTVTKVMPRCFNPSYSAWGSF